MLMKPTHVDTRSVTRFVKTQRVVEGTNGVPRVRDVADSQTPRVTLPPPLWALRQNLESETRGPRTREPNPCSFLWSPSRPRPGAPRGPHGVRGTGSQPHLYPGVIRTDICGIVPGSPVRPERPALPQLFSTKYPRSFVTPSTLEERDESGGMKKEKRESGGRRSSLSGR